jgi:hypothetical protein
MWNLRTPQRVPGIVIAANWTWESLRDKLLPPALRIPVLESAQPYFPFFSSAAALNLVEGSPPRGLLRPSTVSSLIARASLPQRPQPAYAYYSAQMAEARDGSIQRAVDSPLGRALAGHLLHLGTAGGASQANVFVATAGSCTPLHYDAGPNLLSHLVGRKRAVLYPPAAATGARLAPWVSAVARSARAGFDGTADAAAPLGGHAAWVFDLDPGDSLFIPAYWLHHICVGSASGAASVAVWAESAEQAAGRALLNSPLPFPANWPTSDAVSGIMLLSELLAGDLSLATVVALALRSRYSPLPSDAAVGMASASRDRGGAAQRSCHLTRLLTAAAAHQLLVPTYVTLLLTTAASTPAINVCPTQALLKRTAATAHWLHSASEHLRRMSSEAVRTVMLANWIESSLLRCSRAVADDSFADLVMCCAEALGGGGGGSCPDEVEVKVQYVARSGSARAASQKAP